MKQFLPILLLTLLAVVPHRDARAYVYGGDFASEEEEQVVTRAELAYEFRDYDEAWRLTEEALAEYPDSPELLRLKVLVATATGRISELLQRHAPGRVEPGDLWKSRYLRGWTATLTGDPRIALRELEEARDLRGAPPSFEIERAILVARRMVPGADLRELARDYEQFHEQWDHVPLVHLSVLNFYNFRDPGKRARWRLVRRAINRSDAVAGIYLAAARLEEKKFWFDASQGLSWINRGLEAHPNSTDLALRRIMYLRQLGRTQEALAYCRQWRERAPNHGDFRIDEVDLLADLARWDEAIEATRALRDMRHQERYLADQPVRLARLLHYANRPDEAVEVLGRFLREERGSPWQQEAAALLTRLQTRNPVDRVHIIPGVPHLTQRGNYCGPATVSMVMGFWGREMGQDAIAERVYTGIAGTPPQVIHNHARTVGMETVEFAGTEETWKRLLDAGFPILWLQFMREGGHYRVVTGYDDILRSWIVHDPNHFRRETIPYDDVTDLWILPNVVRSIVLFPPGEKDHPALAGLKPTPVMSATNGILYIATGSNLFVGIFPALPINILVGGLLAWLIAWQLRRVTFPAKGIRPLLVVAVMMAIIIPANLVIGLFRLSEVVSLLLGFHLAILTLIPLLLITSFGLHLIQDFLHPRESLGIAIVCILVWLALSFIDREPWHIVAPVGLFVLGMPVILWPRRMLRRAERLSHQGDAPGALLAASDRGLAGDRYYSALCVELENLLTVGKLREFRLCARQLRHANEANGRARDVFDLCDLLGQVLDPGAEDDRLAIAGRIEAYIARPKVNRQVARLAEGLLLYIENVNEEAGMESAERWPLERIDGLLRDLAGVSGRRLAGLSRSRSLRGRPILDTILLLAMIGATHSARRDGERERLQELWANWSSRYAILIRLLSSMTPPPTSQSGAVRLPAQTTMTTNA